ncbi:chromosome partitioning protein [Hydrogenoanaerobacterium saccharovorans]|uniref:Sporulation initiation inhibitor protein Soj n=1 Tax=Hydrogenoanaerobacterium saccharovorans TaxID=474960 RepID=A0A1H8CWJ4_9FIRM|nr:ParA family protein [Hydrogenoanaerobacterium saccharovorans]RPF43363.1 chromosome partitioning protein [Hydrogenoanaerobacterium saccharovorans]SEM99581.1 chromosome partitioning protein [Hydrogenoanaerobacterium saccharovorans]
MSKVIAVANQKGGVGKTTTAISLGSALMKEGKRVLLIDFDPQGSLTICLGIHDTDALEYTSAALLVDSINEDTKEPQRYINEEHSIPFIAGNLMLSSVDVQLVNVIGREMVLKESLEPFLAMFDYIIIDCMPSLGMLTINALTAADSVIIPVQAHFLSAKGLEEFSSTLRKVKKINPTLTIDGILFTMYNKQLNFSKEVVQAIKDTYGESIRVFETMIPNSVRAVESTAVGKPIIEYCPYNPVAIAYQDFAKEVLNIG